MIGKQDPTRRDFLTGVRAAQQAEPSHLHAMIGDNCFTHSGIVCQSCADTCPASAIGFKPRIGGPALPSLKLEDCTGCGDCVAACPASAITLVSQGANLHG